MIKEIFTKEQKIKSDYILNSPFSKLSDLNSKEIKDLAVIWCYYSGKIEGNTYTYVETEALLKDGITSEKRYEDAKMLKNLYNVFINEIEYINKKGNKEEINISTLLRVHKQISHDLVSSEESGHIRTRAVRISGTEYTPPRNIIDIKFILNDILYKQDLYDNPLEKAIYIHCNLARLQPFIDGNKRTARMMESIVLMNANIIPIYSSKDSDILNYRKSLMEFYEHENYSYYSDYLLDKQIERINLIVE